MNTKDMYALLDELAPKSISDELCQTYGMYDNSGILLDVGKEITGVLFSLDFSETALLKAAKSGKNLLVTHHPAIYAKPDKITLEEPLGKKLIFAVENGISVISMHLNLDAATGGIDESLMKGILKAAGETSEPTPSLMQTVEKGGYGRAYDINAKLFELAEKMKEVFKTERVTVYGDPKQKLTRIASFCGAGGDEEAIEFAARQRADAVVSSDFKHHILAEAAERGLGVIVLTHYASEVYGFEKYYQKIRRRLSIPCEFYTDRTLM